MERYIIINRDTLECLTYHKGQIDFSKTGYSNLSYEKAILLYETLFRKYNYLILKLNYDSYKDMEALLKEYHSSNCSQARKEAVKNKILILSI